MKIALFSDIHANLPAFEAFLSDLDSRNPDAVYCLGDLVGYNIWPNEIISEIRKRAIPTIAGNHDLKVRGLESISSEQLAISGKDYAYQIITDEGRDYLTSLPSHIKLDFQLAEQKLNLLLVHGSPRSVNEYVLEDTNEDYVLSMMAEADADFLCVGHSHKPYQRILPSGKRVINIGSVGKPKDGNPMGCYVILNVKDTRSIDEVSVEVEFIRFEYDIERAAKGIDESPLPNELADMLRKAY